MKRLVSILLPLVGLILFVWILRGTGLDRIAEIFRNVDPRTLWIFPLFTVYFVFVRGLRWMLLLRIVGIDYPLGKTCRVWSIGFFAGAVTPGKVGDALRAYYLSRDTGRNLGECLLTVFVDRLMDVLTILVSGAIMMFVFSYLYTEMASSWLVAVAVIAILGLVYLMLRRDLVRRLFRPAYKLIVPDRYHSDMREHFHAFYDGLARYREKWPQTLGVYLVALLHWVGVVLLAYTVARVLAIPLPLNYVVIMMPFLTLMEILPISISGMGTREAAAIFFFNVIGLDSAAAVSFSLMYLVAGVYLTALAGLIAWLFRPKLFRASDPQTPAR